ncbi:MAG TPA: saccharopine dehydrogenase [Firmicutes bacterium]|nr:saccharopine dehydrogenase [Bacillota bacterium]
MKVAVLGGAGDMGSEAVRDLLNYPEVKQVTIIDLNTAAANKLASTLGAGPRIKVRRVDATSPGDLIKVLAGHTVVAGALGPFYRFEKPVVEATLMAGVDYVSICDDYDAAEAVLSLDQEARDRGRKILTGLGWTPGLSNLLARKGHQELEDVTSIKIYWAGSAADSTGFAVILHTIHIFQGLAASFQDGKFMEVQAGSGREAVEFPDPLGRVYTFHVGHPEPVTIPRYLPGLSEVLLKGGLAERYLNQLARLIGTLKLTDTGAKKQRIGRIMNALLPLFSSNKGRSRSGIRVDITGKRERKNVVVSYAAVDNMRRLTGIPLSIGAYLMGKGEIKRCGVYGPEAEGAVDPDRFLEELALRKVIVQRREEELA